MKKFVLLLMMLAGVLMMIGCAKTQTEPRVINTCKGNSIIYYEMSDNTWKTDDYTYKYKLEITGRLSNAVKDTTYIILSNLNDISFEETWKASGLSSNSEEYFKPEDAIIVEWR